MKILARNWKIKIFDGVELVDVKGIYVFNISQNKEYTDVTDFNSNGNLERIPVQIDTSLSFEGFQLADTEGNLVEYSQQIVQQYSEDFKGDHLIFLQSPNGKKIILGGSFNIGEIGGAYNEATSFQFEVEVNTKNKSDGVAWIENSGVTWQSVENDTWNEFITRSDN